MGFRLVDDKIDIYNVILGQEEFAGSGIMSAALRLMIGFIAMKYYHAITAKVLKSNPALTWYIKNGFKIMETLDNYHLIQFMEKPWSVVANDQ